jgi:biopolymer transport protein ExbD
MAMRVSDSFGLAAVFASLLMTHSVLVKQYESPRGVPVLLPRLCTRYESMHKGDGRDVVVRYQFDHSSFVNSQLMPVEKDLRREIVTLMSTRWEQVISFTADERLSYGEVSTVLSDLQKDDPNLFIALMTRKQFGSVDEMNVGKFNDLCLS